jgi:hypothetical protein
MKSVATLFLSLAFLSVTGAWLASSSETEFADKTHDRSALPVTTTQLQPISSVNRDRQFTGMVVAAQQQPIGVRTPGSPAESALRRRPERDQRPDTGGH